MTGVGMGRRPLLVMALGWLAVVVAVGAITFVVVDRAGRGVGQASAARTLVPTAATLPPTPTPTPTTPSTSSPATSPSTPVPTQAPSRPVIKPSVSPTVRQAEVRTASFTTDGGTVVAECAGTELRLVSITPRDGWRFEQESEHGGLEVKFKADEREVEILVVCRRGVPVRAES